LGLTVLGAIVLLWLQRLLSRLLPELPKGLVELEADVGRAMFTGEAYDNSDIDRLDAALTRAELANPGSTLRFNYESLPAIVSRRIGSFVVSLVVTGWYMRLFGIGLRTVAMLVAGLGALLYPCVSWWLSRPRR
jgi:hypothetical protein